MTLSTTLSIFPPVLHLCCLLPIHWDGSLRLEFYLVLSSTAMATCITPLGAVRASPVRADAAKRPCFLSRRPMKPLGVRQALIGTPLLRNRAQLTPRNVIKHAVCAAAPLEVSIAEICRACSCYVAWKMFDIPIGCARACRIRSSILGRWTGCRACFLACPQLRFMLWEQQWLQPWVAVRAWQRATWHQVGGGECAGSGCKLCGVNLSVAKPGGA